MTLVSGIRITVYAGEGPDDGGLRKPSVVSYFTPERDVHETLRQIGLEWKQADYFPTRQVVITLDPLQADDGETVREKVRAAAVALEETGRGAARLPRAQARLAGRSRRERGPMIDRTTSRLSGNAPTSRGQWIGVDSDGDPWKIIIEPDRMKDGAPLAVTIWMDGAGEGVLAEIGPDAARQMSAALVAAADWVEHHDV